jgi:UDP-N-acetylglucosamine acyltransferase
MGTKNIVGYGAVIGGPPQDFAHNESMVSGVRIGNGNTFREHVTIHRGTGEGSATIVGDGNVVMVGAHFGHNARVGNRTVIANNCALAGYVEVQDGRLAMVRGGTRFGQDIVPFAVADEDNILAGLNAIGLRRAGFSSESRLELKRIYRLIFRSGLNVSQALAGINEAEWGPEVQELLGFIRGAKRGICVLHRRRKLSPAGDDADE